MSNTSQSIADILQAGNEATDQLSAARTLSQKSWNDWRNLETYVLPTGETQSRIPMPSVRMAKPGSNPDGATPVMAEIQLDDQHPEHARLKKIAEEADRKVLELERKIFMAQQVSKG
jgi:hypothetical protein